MIDWNNQSKQQAEVSKILEFLLLTIDICVNLFIGYTIKQCKHMIAETNILLRIMIVTWQTS